MKRGAPEHPKMAMLAEELGGIGAAPVPAGLRTALAVGMMEMLWHWTAKYAPQGNVGRYSNAMIAAAARWEGDADALVAALVRCGWLDEDAVHRLVVHDWAEHADEAVKKRLARASKTFADGTVRQPAAVEHDRRAAGQRRDGVETASASCLDSVATASGHCRDGVSTVSRPPEPEPGPEPEPEPVPGPGPGPVALPPTAAAVAPGAAPAARPPVAPPGPRPKGEGEEREERPVPPAAPLPAPAPPSAGNAAGPVPWWQSGAPPAMRKDWGPTWRFDDDEEEPVPRDAGDGQWPLLPAPISATTPAPRPAAAVAAMPPRAALPPWEPLDNCRTPSPPRDPLQPPLPGVAADDWGAACAIATILEQIRAPFLVVRDAGGTKRALAALYLVEELRAGEMGAALREVGMPPGREAEWAAMVMGQLAARWSGDARLTEILQNLRRWPDGLYPSLTGPAYMGRQASRFEQVVRIFAAMKLRLTLQV